MLVSVTSSSRLHAAVPEVQVLTSDEFKGKHSFTEANGALKRNAAVIEQLASVKNAQLKGQFAQCVTLARASRLKAKSLSAWLSAVEIDCASTAELNTANADILAKSLEEVDHNPAWLFEGAAATALRTAVLHGRMALLEPDIKNNRVRAWQSIEVLKGKQMLATADAKTRAKIWKSAGELAFLQQKTEAAHDFFKRSLIESEDAQVRARLAVTEASLGLGKNAGHGSNANNHGAGGNPSLEASSEELQLVERITAALKSGDFLPALDDSMKLIKRYPGGSRAQWAAERVLEAYLSIGDRTDDKFQLLREKFLNGMREADADRLNEWAKIFYNKGFFEESYELSRKALDAMTGVRRVKALEIAGEVALATEHYEQALKYFEELVNQDAGTPSARTALLRIGLLHYRLGQTSKAIADLERLVVLPQLSEANEIAGNYWLWKSLLKIKSDRANAVADNLMNKFPLSYYGLRARFERHNHVLEWAELTKPVDAQPAALRRVESRMMLMATEQAAWKKALILIAAGWLDEAQAELHELPTPSRAEDKAVRALLWAEAGGYSHASQLLNAAWDEKPELRRAPFINVAFPNEWSNSICQQAERHKIDCDLVRSLIKQESSFNPRAMSVSPAYGLMQMIAPTAREIAQDLKMSKLEIPEDLFRPEINIQMGTYYFRKMLTKYNGYVPVALAAYNAGPQRLDRWFRTRVSLRGLTESNADDELWFDELPYQETSGYVKSIMRNYLIYKLLAQGRVEVPSMTWNFEKVSSSAKN
jgi:soluble lytic murein transglycosylase